MTLGRHAGPSETTPRPWLSNAIASAAAADFPAQGALFDELATNAVKHGALRPQGGHVEVSWSLEDEADASRKERMLVLDWIETVAEPVEDDPRGDRAVDRNDASDIRVGSGHGIMGQLVRASGGEMHTELAPTGLRAHVRLPLSLASEADDEDGDADGAERT